MRDSASKYVRTSSGISPQKLLALREKFRKTHYPRKGEVQLIFAWYDFWIGIFWDRSKRRLYVFPIPCFGIVIQF